MDTCPLCINKDKRMKPSSDAPMKSLRALIEGRCLKSPFEGDGPTVHVFCYNVGVGVRDLIATTLTQQAATPDPVAQATETSHLDDKTSSAWRRTAKARLAT